MGSLVVRNASGLSTVAKIGVGVAVCYVGLKVLPIIVGTGILVGVLGLAVVGAIMSILTLMLQIGLYVGVPILFIAFLVSMFSDD